MYVTQTHDPLQPLWTSVWPEGRQPDPGVWFGNEPKRTWAEWTRHRFVEPRPHAVYVIECETPDHWYVGITTDLKRRMKKHAQATRSLLKPEFVDTPSIRFMALHGFKRVDSVMFVPDLVCALEAECELTHATAAQGHVACGRTLRMACPIGDPGPWWTWRNVATSPAAAA